MRLRVILPREVLGSLGEVSTRRNKERNFFLYKWPGLELEAGSSGLQLPDFCYPLGPRHPIGFVFFVIDGPSRLGERGDW